MENYKGQYVGPLKIKSVSDAKDKTYFGNKRVFVEYENHSNQEFPEAIFKLIATPDKSDHTKLRELRTTKIVDDILALLVEAELPVEDANYVLGERAVEMINVAFNEANTVLWGKENYERTLFDVEKVLKNRKFGSQKKEDKKSKEKKDGNNKK